jgi:hypothetical protein
MSDIPNWQIALLTLFAVLTNTLGLSYGADAVRYLAGS